MLYKIWAALRCNNLRQAHNNRYTHNIIILEKQHRFALIIGKDGCSLICGAKSYNVAYKTSTQPYLQPCCTDLWPYKFRYTQSGILTALAHWCRELAYPLLAAGLANHKAQRHACCPILFAGHCSVAVLHHKFKVGQLYRPECMDIQSECILVTAHKSHTQGYMQPREHKNGRLE